MAYNRQAADAARDAASSGRGFDDTWKYLLKMVDGETVMVRFVKTGRPNCDPLNIAKHGTALKDSVPCLRPANCPACNAAAMLDVASRKQTVVRMASARTIWQVLSTRVVFPDVPQQDGKKRTVHLHQNADGRALHVRRGTGDQPDVVTVYPSGRHEFDGVYPWAYEGLMALELSNTKRNPYTQALFDLDAELEQDCQCGKLTEGAIRRPAKVVVVKHACVHCGTQVSVGNPSDAIVCPGCRQVGTPVEVLACEANCGNPKRGGLDQCYVLITKSGQRLDTKMTFKALPPGPMIPEHEALLVDENGKRKSLDLEEIFSAKEAAVIGSIRALAPQLRSFGVDPEQCINPSGATAHAGGMSPPAGGFGGIPTFGAPTATPNPPRIAAAPAPAFPMGGVQATPTGSGAPVGTTPGGAPPLAGGGPAPVPTVSRPGGLRLGGG